MKKLLEVKNLCKDGILHQVSFEVERGEMVAVMGPSGSGKSTLLYNIAGLDQPAAGEVWLDGTEIQNRSEDEKAELRLHQMGFVFQQMNMLSNLNLIDNILLPAVQAQKGKRKKTRSKNVLVQEAKNWMKKLSIEELAERDITQVSGGQLQRACICRSMINAPKILFADEPTGALNQSAAGEVMDEFEKLNKAGTTILVVTHDSKVAARCGRILYLLDGEICGELELSGLEKQTDIERMKCVETWLGKMGW